ncbi:MAG: glycosyltransferase [Alphaproteobacteria bacterium]|nr:glycosyltransferase [Alphaproteobacteria bacterium]
MGSESHSPTLQFETYSANIATISEDVNVPRHGRRIRRKDKRHATGTRIVTSGVDSSTGTLALREQAREAYWKQCDPIIDDRMLWRAQTFRHIMHPLPGQRILELGCGNGAFTRQLAKITRGECPLTAVTFASNARRPADFPAVVEFLADPSFPETLKDRRFDFVIAHDMLDKRNAVWLLQQLFVLLVPGGRVLFYESNPWNVIRRLRQGLGLLFGHRDPRLLLNRPNMYELLSELGFIRVFAVFNDFVYAPLTPKGVWLLRNLSIILENMAGVRTLAGSILLHAQRPPPPTTYPRVSLTIAGGFLRAVSVVVPCHNEEMNVVSLVRRLLELFNDYVHEIILVNDNSKDNTGDIIHQLAHENSRIKPIHRSAPNGVGRALRDGLRAATGKYVLSLDCDFQHLLPEVRDLFDAIAEGYDVAVGSRFSRHSVLLNYPVMKILANRAFHTIARVLLLAGFRDLTNNLKLMRREVVRDLVVREPGFAVNAETGLQPLLMGYRVKEVPIAWIGRGIDMGVSSFSVFKVGGGYWRVLYHLWLSRFLRAGPYGTLRRSSIVVAPPQARRVLRTAR